jgi:hypothetical protein
VYVNDLVYYHNSDRHFARKRSIFLTLQTVPASPTELEPRRRFRRVDGMRYQRWHADNQALGAASEDANPGKTEH